MQHIFEKNLKSKRNKDFLVFFIFNNVFKYFRVLKTGPSSFFLIMGVLLYLLDFQSSNLTIYSIIMLFPPFSWRTCFKDFLGLFWLFLITTFSGLLVQIKWALGKFWCGAIELNILLGLGVKKDTRHWFTRWAPK